MKTFKAFFLLLFASALVLSVNSCNKGGDEEKLPDFNMVRSAAGFKEAIENQGGFGNAQILDFRSEADFAKGHIPGAVNIPATPVNTGSANGPFAQKVLETFDPNRPVYLYGGMIIDNIAAARVAGIGFGKANSNLLNGGFKVWEAAGFDIVQ